MKVTTYYPGDVEIPRGTPIRANSLNRALTIAGADVTNVTAGPQESLNKSDSFILNHNSSVIRRAWKLSEIVRQKESDVIIGFTHMALTTGFLASKMTGRPFYLDLHGDLNTELIESGQNSKFMQWRIRIIERLLIPRVTGIMVVSEALKVHYKGARYIKVLHGGADVKKFHPEVPPEKKIETWKKQAGITNLVGYVGNLRPYQGVEGLLKAMEVIWTKTDSVGFLIVGNGPIEDQCLTLAKRSGKLLVLDTIPHDAVSSHLSACDVLVVPRPSTPTTRLGFPSKLPEYLAMGKPVVATDVADSAVMVKHRETGLLVPPNHQESLCQAILYLNDERKRRTIGQNARAFITKSHTWNNRASELISWIKTINQD